MPDEIRPDSTVSYTVKELLDEQTSLLRQIDGKVDTKADKADLVPILTRLDDHHGRIVKLEDERKADAAAAEVRNGFRRRVWAFSTAVAVPIAVALLLIFVR